MHPADSSSDLNLLPHLAFPVVLTAMGIVCQYTGIDEWLIRPFYDVATQSWPYEKNWWAAGFIHKGGRDLIAVILSLLLLAIIASFPIKALSKYRLNLAYLLVGSLAGILVVALIKNTTHIYEPSDLLQFGGALPHVRLFDSVAPGLPIGRAFPAGHASGAFSLIVFYFLLTVLRSRWRFPALGVCMLLGFTFGLAQQMRGKHFFSHDLFALAICWTLALIVLYMMRIPQRLKIRRLDRTSESEVRC